MTRYSDNILSGFQAATSAASSESATILRRTHNFNAIGGTAPITQLGVFPPNTMNLTAQMFIIQNASATVSNKITVSAGGKDLIVIDQFGSAQGYLGGSVAGLGRLTITASACASLTPPAAGSTNGGEIPYAVTFAPISADKTGSYQLNLTFNRKDTTFD